MKLLVVFAGSTLLLSGAAPGAWGQTVTPQQHSQELASAFTKVKDKVKEKDGVRTETHLRVSNQPWLAATPATYAGTYLVDGFGFELTVEALPTGQLRLTGREPALGEAGTARPVIFTEVRVQDGWLTATKTDAQGRAQPFAAAFLTQSRNGVVNQGLGTKLFEPVTMHGLVLEKLFYQKQR